MGDIVVDDLVLYAVIAGLGLLLACGIVGAALARSRRRLAVTWGLFCLLFGPLGLLLLVCLPKARHRPVCAGPMPNLIVNLPPRWTKTILLPVASRRATVNSDTAVQSFRMRQQRIRRSISPSRACWSREQRFRTSRRRLRVAQLVRSEPVRAANNRSRRRAAPDRAQHVGGEPDRAATGRSGRGAGQRGAARRCLRLPAGPECRACR